MTEDWMIKEGRDTQKKEMTEEIGKTMIRNGIERPTNLITTKTEMASGVPGVTSDKTWVKSGVKEATADHKEVKFIPVEMKPRLTTQTTQRKRREL